VQGFQLAGHLSTDIHIGAGLQHAGRGNQCLDIATADFDAGERLFVRTARPELKHGQGDQNERGDKHRFFEKLPGNHHPLLSLLPVFIGAAIVRQLRRGWQRFYRALTRLYIR